MLMKTSLLGMVLFTTGVVSGLLHPGQAAAQVAGNSYTNTILPGLNLIANQLDHGSNTLDEVLPVVPDGSRVDKWDAATQVFHSDIYHSTDGGWVDANTGS